jgi:hypothetical protein
MMRLPPAAPHACPPSPRTASRRRTRIVAVGWWSVCVWSLTIAVSSHAADPAERQAALDGVGTPFLTKYCVDCHSGAEPAGGLALNQLETVKSLTRERRVWEKLIQRVEIGDMPPEDAELPAEAVRTAFLKWGHQALDDIDCGATPNPGRVTLRRLNRKEYYNTVKSLLGVEFKPAHDFPGDDVGYGFDNIGDVLSLPPLLMEKYLRAAEEISQLAIAAPEPGLRFEETYVGNRLKMSGGGQLQQQRALFYSNGAAEVTEQLPFGAEYKLEFLASGDQAGDEPVKLVVTVDGKQVREVAVEETRQQAKLVSIPVRLRAGEHSFKIEFVNDFYKEGKDGQPTLDRNAYIDSITLKARKPGPKLDPSQLPATHKALVTVEPGSGVSEEQATRRVLKPIVHRAFRRPVPDAELERFVQLALAAQAQGDSFEASLQLAIQAVLVSPHFLFRIEPPRQPVAGEKYARLNDFEIATRLSYFLWSTMPDGELMDLARKQQLTNPDVLRAQVQRMLADKRSNEFVENFAGQWLTLPKLSQFEANPQLFPDWNEKLRGLMRYETLAFFAGVMREDLSIFALLDGQFTYVNEELAKFYGLPGVTGPNFRKVTTAGTPRRGLLTQGAVLAVTSNPTRTSPVKRGKWILDNLLGTPPPPAPPGVPELEQGQLTGTLRERLEQHRANPACASCHKLMDPLGFALENYDAIGRWRTKDGEEPIDPVGELPGGQVVRNAEELIAVLRQEQADRFARCLAEKMLVYALGRGVEYYDKCAVDKILEALARDNHRFSTLVTEIVLSDPFLRLGEREEP